MVAISLILAVVLCWTGSGVAVSAKEADKGAGQAKYEQLCAGCHGVSGKGDGPAAAALNPKPRDHTNCEEMAKESDSNLMKVIKEGGQSTGRSPLMPAWGGALTDSDVVSLVAYIRSFCQK